MRTELTIKRRLPRCCICGKPYTGHGNNAEPLRENGRCCDRCNHLVVAARILADRSAQG